jgi:hypothetical protein
VSHCSGGAVDAFHRAAERARPILKAGDRVFIDGCGGARSTVTFIEWVNYKGEPDLGGDLFRSASCDELHPWNIHKVNKVPMTFRDEDGEKLVALGQGERRALAAQRNRKGFHVIGDAP